MRYLATVVALAAALLTTPGCSGGSRPSVAPPGTPHSANRSAFDAKSLVDELRVYEPAVEETRTASSFGRLASGQAVRLQHGWVEVYTFPTARQASSVVGSISADGSGGPFGGAPYSQVEWKGVPHMFHRDRVIAIFLTEPWRSDTPSQGVEVLDALKTLMGSQFAGGE